MIHNLTNLLVAYGPWGILLLAFIDSAGIPVAVGMDALIIFLAARNPAGALWYAFLGVLGSTLGNLALFWLARQGGRRFLDRHTASERSRRLRAWFLRYGLLTVFIPAMVPIPLPMKVFVVSAGALQVPFPGFTAVVVAGRALRYGGEAWLGAQVGEHSIRYLSDHVGELALFATALFVFLYGLVRIHDRWRRPAPGLE